VKRPAGIFCAGCGYDLAGIGSGRCPECAREFDATDAKTYDTRWRGLRRARLARRGIMLAALLVMVAALCPRGYSEASLTFRSPGSQPVRTVRVQLMAPGWLDRLTALEYPGWTLRASGVKPSARAIAFTSCTHRFTLHGLTTSGVVDARNDALNPGELRVNSVRATPQNADAVLRSVLPSSGRRGIMSVEADAIGVGDK
jgi:hypothetical protein